MTSWNYAVSWAWHSVDRSFLDCPVHPREDRPRSTGVQCRARRRPDPVEDVEECVLVMRHLGELDAPFGKAQDMLAASNIRQPADPVQASLRSLQPFDCVAGRDAGMSASVAGSPIKPGTAL
jgi:hypothetical protein